MIKAIKLKQRRGTNNVKTKTARVLEEIKGEKIESVQNFKIRDVISGLMEDKTGPTPSKNMLIAR